MKKSLILITFIASLFSSNVFAKTQGNYVGVNILNTNFKDYALANSAQQKVHNSRDFGVGFDYKYAISFNNFFIAPGVFYNFNNTSLKFTDSGVSINDKLKYGYGLKSDFGYDISDNFAAFATLGYVEQRIESSVSTISTHLTDEAALYGIGAKYSINNNFDLVGAYEYLNYISNKTSNKINVEIFRVGVSYNF